MKRKPFKLAHSYRIAVFFLLLNAASALSFDAVRGANSALDLTPDARSSALAGVRLGLMGEAGAMLGHPAALVDAEGGWLHLSHASHFMESRYDWLALVLRPDSNDALGFSVSRFGTDGVPLTHEGEIYEGEGWESFSVADWVATAAFARQWSWWRVGGAVHFLWRDLDQQGFGFRADLSGGWVRNGWRVEALFRGVSGSGVLWESGHREISPPDLLLGAGWSRPLPYFYGTLHLAWQSKGVFQKEAKSSVAWQDDEGWQSEAELVGARAWEEPLRWLAASSMAMEFVVQEWVALRFGIPSLFAPQEWSAGGGVRWRSAIRVDYAFRRHPALQTVHQVTLSLYPGVFLKKERLKL